MKLTDGKKTVEIRMMVWEGSKYTPDWSEDFFVAETLHRNAEGAYIVRDVDYCVDQAQDWKNRDGDFAIDDYGNEEREVFVEEIEAEAEVLFEGDGCVVEKRPNGVVVFADSSYCVELLNWQDRCLPIVYSDYDDTEWPDRKHREGWCYADGTPLELGNPAQ